MRQGQIDDPYPDVTAQFLPGMIRSAFRHGPTEFPAEELTRHILRVVGQGVRAEEN